MQPAEGIASQPSSTERLLPPDQFQVAPRSQYRPLHRVCAHWINKRIDASRLEPLCIKRNIIVVSCLYLIIVYLKDCNKRVQIDIILFCYLEFRSQPCRGFRIRISRLPLWCEPSYHNLVSAVRYKPAYNHHTSQNVNCSKWS